MNQSLQISPILTTVIANSSDFDNCSQPNFAGEFYIKTNIHMNTEKFASVCCNNVAIDNAILNYQPRLHNVMGKHNYHRESMHIDTIDDFITAVLGPNQSQITYDHTKNKTVVVLNDGETLNLSKEFADILGFTEKYFTGPAIIYSQKAPDIYRKFRKIYLCAEFCETTFVDSDRKEQLLCVINSDKLGPVDNQTTVINGLFDYTPSWKKLARPLGIYTRLILCDSSFQPIPFLPCANLNIQLTFRSLSFYENL